MSWKNFDLSPWFQDKKILIAGYGKEGKSTHRTVLPYASQIWVTDSQSLSFGDKKTQFIPENELEQLKEKVDLIIKSPGYPLKKLNIFPTEKITSQADLFLSWFRHKVIGVTGTKGKSTLATLIYHVLKENCVKVLLGGNIGIPAFDLLSEEEPTWVVLELSANQLETLHFAPHIALFNNLYEEHLDYFGSYENYQKAKWNIVLKQEQNDWALLHVSLLGALEITQAKSTLMLYGQPSDHFSLPGIAIADQAFLFYQNMQRKVFSFSPDKIPLVGRHNLENCSGALLAAWMCGIPFKKSIESLYTFTPLPHRLEKVGIFRDILFVNDSISTIPQATIAALESLKSVHTLILGGYDRGIHYQSLAEYFKSHPHYPALLLLVGQSGKRMYELFREQKIPQTFIWTNTLEEAVKKVFELTPPGNICLLSPASASYDQFKNFEERGEVFKNLCKTLA